MERELIPKFRIAPTPSGFLHLGNLLNFVLTKVECLKQNGSLRLRLDDIDHSRVRDEFLEDVFITLDWLGFEYDLGPSGVDDFQKNYSQVLKRDLYLKEREKISELFVCKCSRKEVQQASSDEQYPGTCHQLKLSYEKVKTCIRMRTSAEFSFLGICPHLEMRDFLIWSKEDLPTYQLVSVVDDLNDGITHIIRGEDLAPSSAAQAELAHKLDRAEIFKGISWHHHPLLKSSSGEKLSKSKSDLSLKLMREAGQTRAQVFAELARLMNLKDPQNYRCVEDFISLPSLYRLP